MRRLKATPRTTIAISARVNGASRTVPRAANPAGKAENRIVIEKISHTWFASHSGPMVRRECGALLGAVAEGRIEDSGSEIGAGQDGVCGQGEPETDRDEGGEARLGHAHDRAWCEVGVPVGTRRTPQTVTALKPM